MEMHEYLELLTAQIRCKKARGMVEEEVRAHMEDQAEAFERGGMSREDAVKETVRQMGSPVEAGVALDRVHRPGMDWKLLGLVGLLSLLGLAVQYLIGPESNGVYLFGHQCMYTILGIFVMFAACWMDYSLIGRFPLVLWLGLSLSVMLVVLFWPSMNGTNNYIRPLIYLYVPVYVGILYRCRGNGYGALLKCGAFCLASCLISMQAITLPVCLDVAVICLILTVLAVWRGWFQVSRKKAFGILGGGAILLPVAVSAWYMLGGIAAYQIARIRAWMNPSLYPEGSGYQNRMVRAVLQGSALVGQREPVLAGQVYEAAELIPGSSYSDYVLTYIISYYGILAGVAVVLLLALFLFHIFRTSAKQNNQLGQMTGIACGLVFAVQLYHYVMYNLGIGLISGINLPFFTYGRWNAVITYMLTGLLLSVYRYKDVVSDQRTGDRKRYRLRIEKIE